MHCEAAALTRSHAGGPHRRDCGLACVLMVLHALGRRDVTLHMLRMRCRVRSVWTIDLAHMLHGYGLCVALSTITLGANAEYAAEAFYAGDLAADAARVARLFRVRLLVGASAWRGGRERGGS